MPADHRRGLAVARKYAALLLPLDGQEELDERELNRRRASLLDQLEPIDLARCLNYAHALAVDGRCGNGVVLLDAKGQFAGTSRCALPVEWNGARNKWEHWGKCEPWQGGPCE